MTMAVMKTYLPGELINEILLRLPLKSVVRFRCVSKKWQSLISSPEFSTLHLNQSKKGTRSPSLVIISEDDTSMFYTIAREAHNSPYKVGNWKIFFSLSHKLDYRYRYIPHESGQWKLKKLPPFPVEFYFSHQNWVGFGFAPVSRVYKVVKIVCYTDRQWHIRNNVSVYSLNSVNDSWRVLEDIPVPDAAVTSFPVPSSAIIINGVAHWVFRSGKVYSFDLVHEVRRELPSLPVFSKYNLYEMGGSQLAAFYYNLQERFPKVEMWVMTEIGVQQPWTKRGIIDLNYPDSWNRQLGNLWNYYPVVGKWNDDDILFQHVHNGKLVLYNTKNNMKRNLEIDGLATTAFLTISLTESLVKLIP